MPSVRYSLSGHGQPIPLLASSSLLRPRPLTLSIAGLTGLHKLSLKGLDAISQAGLQQLAGHTKLTSLSLELCEGVDDLRALAGKLPTMNRLCGRKPVLQGALAGRSRHCVQWHFQAAVGLGGQVLTETLLLEQRLAA